MARRAVVTGGGTGIGKAVARRLADAGASVTIVGRRADVLARASLEINDAVDSDTVAPLVADLTDPEQITDAAAAIRAEGPVDVLVLNAGGSVGGDPSTLAELADAWRRDFDANVLTAVLLTEALRDDLRRPGGRVIGISSIAALRGAGSYGAAKGAMHSWVLSLATQLGPDGITVNAVAPGFIPDTEFWEGRLTPEVVSVRVNATPVGRPGTPEEVAEAVAYLASEHAGFTTGQILQVNGGWMLGRG
jgi:3-oxoacyl-[acyl-carrier protein] reductase